MSNSLDPDQAQHSVGPHLGLVGTVCKAYLETTNLQLAGRINGRIISTIFYE